MGAAHIGLSGFSYKPWQGEGRFYPPGLKQSEFFAFYSRRYETVEIDGSWYRMPGEAAVEQWRDASPPGFTFCFKAHRSITHIHRLKPECQESLRFLVKRIGPLLGVLEVGCEDTGHLDPQPAQSLDMDRSDKSGADHGGFQ